MSLRQIGLSFSKWLPQFNADLYYAYGSYGQFVESLDGVVAENLVFMNLGEFTRTDASGNQLGKFRSNEFSIGLSYGTLLGDNGDFGLGFTVKYIQSNLAPAAAGQAGAGTGISGAFDIGFQWRPQQLSLLGMNLDNVVSLGVALNNVGPKMTYINESDPLPTMLRFGGGFKVVEDEYNDLTLALEFGKLLVSRDSLGSDPIPVSFITAWGEGGIETSIGMEYWYDRIIALRGGFFSEPAAAGDRQYFTLGAGVRYEVFQLDFSYIITTEENHPLANTLRFAMLVDWGLMQ